jgi:uncharacterized protein YjbI with pentapeptide repeats
MTKKTSAKPAKKLSPVPLKAAGKTFVLDSKLTTYPRGEMAKLIRAEGGKVCGPIASGVDYLVLDLSRNKAGRSLPEKEAAKANAAGAAIQILDEKEFYQLFLPTKQEAVALLRGGPAGRERCQRLLPPIHLGLKADLSGINLRGADLEQVWWLRSVNLEGADLRGANLRGASLYGVSGVRLEGACLDGICLCGVSRCSFDGLSLVKARAWAQQFSDCTFRGADLSNSFLDAVQLERCDLSGTILRHAELNRCRAVETKLPGADLRGAKLSDASWPNTDFTGANLAEAQMHQTAFAGAILAKCDLRRAELGRAKLAGADLRGADLRHANLAEADLRGALLDGANFDGANVRGCKLPKVKGAHIRGLAEALKRVRPPGPNLVEIEKLARKVKTVELHAVLEGVEWGRVEITIRATDQLKYLSIRERRPLLDHVLGWCSSQNDLAPAIMNVAAKWSDGALQVDSVRAKVRGPGPSDKELARIALAAWCEALGLPVLSAEEARKQRQTGKGKTEENRESLLQLLRGGKKGVARWNALSKVERRAGGNFRGVDLSGADLRGADLQSLDAAGATFANANLVGAILQSGTFRKTSFAGGDLEGAKANYARFLQANFDQANLKEGNFRGSSFIGASFPNADLRRADFRQANLCRADLSTANLQDTQFQQTKYDAGTRFPAGFNPKYGFQWVGASAPPALAPPRPAPPSPRVPIDFATFMKDLGRKMDPARLEKALAMLKADRFRLYARVAKDHVVGVVKSQGDPNLVYSCRLASDGSFACCTQNLNVCGGLRGALCKHLLVLIVGLAKADQLDPTEAGAWVEASRARKPFLDRDVMSETFLQYKGAEAGEVDWRPTETIPEDYYTL